MSGNGSSAPSSLRQYPDRLGFRGRHDPPQIGLGFGRPVEQMKRGLCQIHDRFAGGMGLGMLRVFAVREVIGHRPRFDLMPAQRADHLNHLRQHADQVGQIGFQPDQFRPPNRRIIIRHALGQTGHAVGLNPELAFARQKVLVRRVQPETGHAIPDQPHQPLTAQPQMQPCLGQRPMRRNLNLRMGKGQRRALILPAMALFDRRARPASSRSAAPPHARPTAPTPPAAWSSGAGAFQGEGSWAWGFLRVDFWRRMLRAWGQVHPAPFILAQISHGGGHIESMWPGGVKPPVCRQKPFSPVAAYSLRRARFAGSAVAWGHPRSCGAGG